MRRKQGNEVLNTTVTNTQTLYLFLLHTATKAHLLLHILLDMTSQIAILYFAYCKYSEQLASHASEFVSMYTAQRCDLGLNFVYRVCACIYLIFFVYVSICI